MHAMDETPEELEQIRREAEQIDVHQYRRRFRMLKAILLGAGLAGLTWLGLALYDGATQPVPVGPRLLLQAGPGRHELPQLRRGAAGFGEFTR